MSTRRVLVIDDCVDSHELIRAALEEDYEVFGIKDPRRYADAIGIAEPDLVILDMLMPGMSGMEILDRVQKDPGPAKAIPFVVLSAKRNIEEQKKAYSKGVKLYLNKPFEPPRLLRNIQMFFENDSLPKREKTYKLHELDYQMELKASSAPPAAAEEPEPTPERPKVEKKSSPPRDPMNASEAQPKSALENQPQNPPKGVSSAGASSVQKRLDEEAEDAEAEPRWVD